MSMLLALRDVATWGIVDFIKAVVIIAAILGIAYLALQYFEVTIPPILIKIFWIVVVCLVALVAINLIASM